MHYSKGEGVVYRELEGETIILNSKTGFYFGLDPVGTRIWQIIHDGASADEVKQRLVAEYDVDNDQASSDVDKFITELCEAELLRTADA